jgi:SIR2-like domain
MLDVEYPPFRIFILGAGFSKPAGLPLATELFSKVKEIIEIRYGKDTKFHRDVEDFLNYCRKCEGADICEESLDLEQLMTYLDIEHYLQLRGKHTWSQEGNESQLMIRKAIGEVIYRNTPKSDCLPDVYYRFAEKLMPSDIVLTFNYDLVLENALTYIGKPFRRYPHRFNTVDEFGGYLNTDAKEVILLKLHGSIDWFDDREYLELRKSHSAQDAIPFPVHSVFDNPARFGVSPLVDGKLPETDPLRHIHTIQRIDDFYDSRDGELNAPFILAPSYVKFVYSEPILSFWNGLGRAGTNNYSISVIGFSLPQHDEYIRIGLYQMFSNYGSLWDLQDSGENQESYRNRYKFANTEQTRFFFKGFDHEAIEFLFNYRRSI